jgi:outer membrane lipoprotein-sorting protein
MKFRRGLSLLAVTSVLTGAAAAQTDAQQFATDKIRDLSATLRVIDSELDSEALESLGREFSTSYRIPRYEVWYKFPQMARFEGKAGILTGVLIYNGDWKKYQVGFIKKKENVAGKPGKKQSLMDLGIFSRDWLRDYVPIFVKKETNGTVVFKLAQKNSESKSFEVVSVDPRTKITVKRLSYGFDGKLRKELRYTQPKEIAPGIFFPTRVELYNQHQRKAGAQTLEKVVVNKGVADERFKI